MKCDKEIWETDGRRQSAAVQSLFAIVEGQVQRRLLRNFLLGRKDSENARMDGKTGCQCDIKALTLQPQRENTPFWQTFCRGESTFNVK